MFLYWNRRYFTAAKTKSTYGSLTCNLSGVYSFWTYSTLCVPNTNALDSGPYNSACAKKPAGILTHITVIPANPTVFVLVETVRYLLRGDICTNKQTVRSDGSVVTDEEGSSALHRPEIDTYDPVWTQLIKHAPQTVPCSHVKQPAPQTLHKLHYWEGKQELDVVHLSSIL